MKNKSVYYAKMNTSYAGTDRLQTERVTLNDPYTKLETHSDYHKYYIYVFKKFHRGKFLSNYFSLILGVFTFILFFFALERFDYKNRVFPTSFSTYYTKSWRNMSKVERLIEDLSKTSLPKERIRLAWEWGGCTRYITSNNIPKANHPATLVPVSSTDPVYVPGGCNCLAQVAGTIKNETFSTQNTDLYSNIQDQFEFCTLFAPMPTEQVTVRRSIRIDTFIYGFILTSLVAILASNYKHWNYNIDKENYKYFTDRQATKMNTSWIALGALLVTFVVTLVFNLTCKDCDPELKNLDWIWSTLIMAILLFCGFYFANLWMRTMNTTVNRSSTSHVYEIEDIMKTMGVPENEAENHNGNNSQNLFDKIDENKIWTSILSASNAVAGHELLIFDVISIPALIYLTIGISVLRSWLDVNIIIYNITLVLFLATFYTASNYMSAKWAIKYDKEQREINDEYQLYKFCSFFAGLFIIITLSLTALPGVRPNYYHLDILDNWWFFVVALGLIYVLPDIVSEFTNLNLQVATTFRQWVLLLLVTFIILLQMNVEWFKQDLFVQSLFA
eukprot:763388-Hanusia_phi.AAC.9